MRITYPSIPSIRRLHAGAQDHADFIILLVLFITFRILVLAAYRPGGLVLDFSNFYWYRDFAALTRQGYYPFDNLWITYPPLFPVVLVAIYQASQLLPPWDYANLWFTLLLGGFLLLFEVGNFILLYLFALKLYGNGEETADEKVQKAIRPCWIYAALFVPIYTVTGWFESYPIFFFLLSLYLLLQNRPYLSAFFTGIGFMIKLIPVILAPIAIQLFSKIKYQVSIRNKRLVIAKLSEDQVAMPSSPEFKLDQPTFVIPFDLTRTALYLAIFLAMIVLIAIPFYLMNPRLIFGPQIITSARPPWETIWALIDGNYDYGAMPLDVRNMNWNPADVVQPSRIPWRWITACFGLVYLFFYTRPIQWRHPRNALAFTAFTVSLFMLWSKGFSPEWLNWPLFFIALLLPNLRGVIYAVVLSVVNIIEANFFFIIFPNEHWLLATTVLIRTFLLIVTAVEFLWLIWPQMVTTRVATVRAWAVTAFVALLIIGAVPAGLELGRSYFEFRQEQSPYAATISRLKNEQVTGALLLNSNTVYDWFYPYLGRDKYELYMLDDYAMPGGASVETRTVALLNRIAEKTDVLWIYDADASQTTPSEEALAGWLGDLAPAHLQDIDGGRLYLFILDNQP